MRRCLYAAAVATALVARCPDAVLTGLVAVTAVATAVVVAGLLTGLRPRTVA